MRKKLVFYSDSGEQCTLNVSDVECTHDFSECSDDTVAINKAKHERKLKTGLQ
jgi:hypothetical protein